MYKSITPNLMTESVEETIRFYTENLGFAEIASVPDEKTGKLQFVILGKDNLTIMFQQRESLAGEYPELAADKVSPGCTIYIKVDDVKKFAGDIGAKVKLIRDLHKTFYGANEFAILDNNGYVLTFAD
ncbi:MAG: VOC family protein [Endomicrobia bacterium]|nr:VOC family protein [Endomicrobiia bacterium]